MSNMPPPRRFKDIDRGQFYTIGELAPILRIAPRTLRRYCVEGTFATAKNPRGKQWLILGQSVLDVYGNEAKDQRD